MLKRVPGATLVYLFLMFKLQNKHLSTLNYVFVILISFILFGPKML